MTRTYVTQDGGDFYLSKNKAKHVCIGHYFPDMVHTAIKEAREELRRLQSFKVRAA